MIQFASPVWFWAFLAFPLFFVLFLQSERRRKVVLDRLIAARLQPRLAGTVSVAKRRVSFVLTVTAFAFSVMALARPQWGFSWDERRDMGRDILIAIDTSRSMLAADLQPNRLKRAKLAAEDLLSHVKGDRVGVIAFAGSSFLQAPLTADFAATRDTLSELDTDIIPRGGTNLTEAIIAADDAFGKGESDQRALIIFTDGEELEEDAIKAARDHKDKFRIFTVGLGSPDGALIPLPSERGGTQFVRDEKGEYVKSKLDEKRLREVAEAGGGFYVHLQNGPAEMKQIATEGLGTMKEAVTNETRFSKRPTERYQWPLAVAVACWIASLLVGERKRVARTAAALVMFSLMAQPANADTGEKLFAKADYAGAAKSFEEQRVKRQAPELDYNLGVSAYKAGDLDKAGEALSGALGNGGEALQSKAAFSLANVLARRGVKQEKREEKLSDWKNAVQHYDRTLALQPGHPDAAHNRDLVKKLIEETEKKQDDKQDKKDEKKDEEKKDQEKNEEDKKDGEQKSGDEKDGEKKEQEKKDGEKSEKGKDGEKKDGEKSEEGKDGEKNDGEKSEDGKDGEKKDGEKSEDGKDGEKKDGEKKEKSDKPGEKPEKAEQQKEGEKKQGELKSANPGEKSEEQKQEAADAAEEMAAAKEGRMTARDAKQLLESMRVKERRVRLLDPRQEVDMQNKPRPEKNW